MSFTVPDSVKRVAIGLGAEIPPPQPLPAINTTATPVAAMNRPIPVITFERLIDYAADDRPHQGVVAG
jgi:hypothetical protein